MATCKHCGKPLIVNKGKCLYCGAAVESSSQDVPVERPQSGIKKPRPIIQRRSFVNQGDQSPYSQYAGQSIISGAKTDRYGNPQGSQYDLAKDGAFKGYKIVVLYFCWQGDMSLPKPALEKKGFSVLEFRNTNVPTPQQLKELLDDDRNQLWMVSGEKCYLSQMHYSVIYDHYNKGRGLYIWSDNTPYFADSNIILSNLFHSEMFGDCWADQVLSIQQESNMPGIIKNHAITTGIQNFYEGHTITCVKMNGGLKPLVYCSDSNIVTAYYDLDKKRCLIDGGFTRLYYKWDSAGTDRFVVNCAAWLTNIERFGYHPDR